MSARAGGVLGTAGEPAITVVTVCRNALPLLRSTAESVLAQERAGLEYWIVDGASTDGTADYLKELSTRNVRVVSESDRGIADAMNKGIRLASGEWIAYLHAGDTYLPGALDAVMERVRAGARDRADILCGHIVKREERDEILYRCEPKNLRMDMTIHHPAAFTRRSVLEEFGGFDERYPNAMDYDLFLRAFARGKRFEIIPRALARMAGGGQSERSLWITHREAHAIRRLALTSGWERSAFHFLFLFIRAAGRRILQRAGLGRLVAWYRARFAMAPKG